MKTTIDIPSESMNLLLQAAGCSSKKQAVNMAIDDYIHRARAVEIKSMKGSCTDFITREDLKEIRND